MSRILNIIKKQYLLIIALVSVVAGLILTTNNALTIYAETINAGVLKIEYSGSGALFNENNIYPGYEITKNVTVTNQGSVPHSFSIAIDGTLGSLADVLVIEPSYLGSTVWSKTVSDIKKNPESDLIIGSIAPGGVANVDFKAYLPESVGNAYMGTSTFSFDFVMGNESTDEDEPGDEEKYDGGDRSAPDMVASTFSGTANIGSAESEDEIVEEEASEVDEQNEKGEALGAKTEELPVCYWWWILLIVFAIFLLVYGYLHWNRERVIVWFWPVFFGIVLYLIHWIIHDYYHPSDMCPYFVLFQIAGLLLYGGGIGIRKSQVVEKE